MQWIGLIVCDGSLGCGSCIRIVCAICCATFYTQGRGPARRIAAGGSRCVEGRASWKFFLAATSSEDWRRILIVMDDFNGLWYGRIPGGNWRTRSAIGRLLFQALDESPLAATVASPSAILASLPEAIVRRGILSRFSAAVLQHHRRTR